MGIQKKASYTQDERDKKIPGIKMWNIWASSYQHLQVPRAQFRQTSESSESSTSCWITATSEASVISSLDI